MYSHSDYEDNPFLACREVGNQLGLGRLSLFLGAGASFGLPRWVELVRRVTKTKKQVRTLAKLSNKDLQLMVDQVDDGTAHYVKSIHEALYADRELNEKEFLKLLQQEPLLLSVAALVTGASRGRVKTIFTYNYDDTLERYLQMLGFSFCIRTKPTDLSNDSDVEINHVHGYLPASWEIGQSVPEIILSEKSYRSRRSWIDGGWSSYVEHSHFSKISLFVGMSGDDSAVLDVLGRANTKIERPSTYNGYWLLSQSAFERNAAQLREVGMCPIRLSREEVPQFILTVCQCAAKIGAG